MEVEGGVGEEEESGGETSSSAAAATAGAVSVGELVVSLRATSRGEWSRSE